MKKIEPITQEEWLKVNPVNRDMVDSFLGDSVELSSASLKSYYSNLKIFFTWCFEHAGNKGFAEVKSLDFKRFVNWMVERGCSSSDIRNKKSAVSSFYTYIETYYIDDYPMLRSPINKSIKLPPLSHKREKEPLTIAESNELIQNLTERKELAKLAYILFALETGARKGEIRQLRKDLVNTVPKIDANGVKFYETPKIRAKGRGKEGKIRTFVFGEKTMEAFKHWVDTRDDDCEYMFIQTVGGTTRQASPTFFNNWHNSDFDRVVGRKTFPHLMRHSRATQLSEEMNVDIKRVSKLLGHSDTKITECYIKRKENDDIEDLLL